MDPVLGRVGARAPRAHPPNGGCARALSQPSSESRVDSAARARRRFGSSIVFSTMDYGLGLAGARTYPPDGGCAR